LPHRTPGQIAATEPGRKSKVVLNAGAHSSLATGRFPLNHHSVQTFRGAINGRSQTSGPASDNGKVVKTGLRPRPQAHFLRHVRRYTFEKLRPVREQHNREVARLWTYSCEQALRFRAIGRRFNIDHL